MRLIFKLFGFIFATAMRTVITLAIIAAAVWGVISFLQPAPEPAPIAEPPRVSIAPYMVVTPTRIYFTANYEREGNGVYVYCYWEQEGDEWVYVESELYINDKFHQVEIIDR